MRSTARWIASHSASVASASSGSASTHSSARTTTTSGSEARAGLATQVRDHAIAVHALARRQRHVVALAAAIHLARVREIGQRGFVEHVDGVRTDIGPCQPIRTGPQRLLRTAEQRRIDPPRAAVEEHAEIRGVLRAAVARQAGAAMCGPVRGRDRLRRVGVLDGRILAPLPAQVNGVRHGDQAGFAEQATGTDAERGMHADQVARLRAEDADVLGVTEQDVDAVATQFGVEEQGGVEGHQAVALQRGRGLREGWLRGTEDCADAQRQPGHRRRARFRRERETQDVLRREHGRGRCARGGSPRRAAVPRDCPCAVG